MRRMLAVLLVLMISAGCTACCRGDTAHTVVIPGIGSDFFTDRELKDGIDEIKACFCRDFPGCTLRTIQYAGDVMSLQWSHRHRAMVFISSFDVDESGCEGTLEPNSTYKGWQWLLIRNAEGTWELEANGHLLDTQNKKG